MIKPRYSAICMVPVCNLLLCSTVVLGFAFLNDLTPWYAFKCFVITFSGLQKLFESGKRVEHVLMTNFL